MADLTAMMHVDRDGQEILFLLVADESCFKPKHGLGKVHRPAVIKLVLETLRKRDRPPNPVL